MLHLVRSQAIANYVDSLLSLCIHTEPCTVNSTTLSHPVTIAQVPVPTQVCYVIPVDASEAMLTSIFEECYNRWGGRDTLLMPMLADGTIDERFWLLARALDPDIIYSYVPLDVPTLERIDRELMPAIITIHRHDPNPLDMRPNLEHDAQGIPSLSLLPMLANADRLGPPRPLALLSKFQEWSNDGFITDSFGLNPFGPNTAQAEVVRKYISTVALGNQSDAQHGHIADADVANVPSLLRAMSDGTLNLLTMAQLSGWGYGDVFNEIVSPWPTFNIVVGSTALDRIAFWNSRIGSNDWERRNIVAVRFDEDRLDDPEFIAALVFFVGRWNTSKSQNGPSNAAIRSSSVAPERLTALVDPLMRVNVHAVVARFADVNACVLDHVENSSFVRAGVDQRFTDSKVLLTPVRPRHLVGFEPMSSWLVQGSWAIRATIKRERDGSGPGIPLFPIPRHWQAIRHITGSSVAKVALNGDLRLIIKSEQNLKPAALSFVEDDANFIENLFYPHHYLTNADPRRAIPARTMVAPRISSAGRHLLGLLNKLGSIRSAYDVLENPYWKAVFQEMAVPRQVFDGAMRTALAERIQSVVQNDGPAALTGIADFENLAVTVARIAPDLKVPVSKQNFEWFVEKYRATDTEHPGDATPEEVETKLRAKVESELRERCAEGILVQGHDWRCPRCLHVNWVTLEFLGRILTCEVCSRQQPISTSFAFDFLLDGYVGLGLRMRGLRGLVWALGFLSGSATDSFMFSPPISLMSQGRELTDCDIACVIDGKFVIGEVKESARNINASLIDGLINIARIARPDYVLLACSDPASLATVKRHTDRMDAELRGIGIRALPLVRDPHLDGWPAIIAGKGFWPNAQAALRNDPAALFAAVVPVQNAAEDRDAAAEPGGVGTEAAAGGIDPA
jgi:hypothetical protein